MFTLVLITPVESTHLTTLPPLYGLIWLSLPLSQAAPHVVAVPNPKEVAISTTEANKVVSLTNPLNGS